MSSSRSTTFSPQMTPVVATRMSSSRPSIVMAIWPSCGRRRSTMFMPAMILTRLARAGPMESGSASTSCSAPSMRIPDADPVVLRLDVDVGGAVAQRLGDDLLDDLHDGASSAPTLLVRRRDLAGPVDRGEGRDVVVHVGEGPVGVVDDPSDLGLGCEREPHLAPGRLLEHAGEVLVRVADGDLEEAQRIQRHGDRTGTPRHRLREECGDLRVGLA